MLKILVTGGAGFIGSHIVDRCIAAGYKVVVVDNLSTGKRENINREATFYQADIRLEDMSRIFEKESPDVVIHHAAQIDVNKSILNPFEDAGINITGTINLLKEAVAFRVKKFIYASSAAVYGAPETLPVTEDHPKAPLSFYGVSKFVPEYYIQIFASLHRLDYTIFRYANVYGERQDPKGEGGVISIFLDRMLQRTSVDIYGDGNQTRDFIYVKDVAEANFKAIDSGNNEIMNLGTSTAISLNELVEKFEEVLGRKQEVVYKQPRRGDIVHSCLENRLAREKLNWYPVVSLLEGIERVRQYYAPAYEIPSS